MHSLAEVLSGLPVDEVARRCALTYLGQGTDASDEQLSRHLRVAAERCVDVASARSCVRTFDARDPDVALSGARLKEHLAGAVEVTLFCVTLGAAVDRELRLLAATNPFGEAVFDAVASAATERLADAIEADVRAKARARGLFCGWRFSPGYADTPLAEQTRVLALLDAARTAGITCTSSHLMVPTKSVTAIIGVHEEPQEGLASTCGICDLRRFCTLRRRGVTCGNRGDVSDLGSGERN